MIKMADFNYESRHENCGLYLQDGCWAWEETLERDDDCSRNIAIRAKIAADDRAFLESCGIRPETL